MTAILTNTYFWSFVGLVLFLAVLFRFGVFGMVASALDDRGRASPPSLPRPSACARTRRSCSPSSRRSARPPSPKLKPLSPLPRTRPSASPATRRPRWPTSSPAAPGPPSKDRPGGGAGRRRGPGRRRRGRREGCRERAQGQDGWQGRRRSADGRPLRGEVPPQLIDRSDPRDLEPAAPARSRRVSRFGRRPPRLLLLDIAHDRSCRRACATAPPGRHPRLPCRGRDRLSAGGGAAGSAGRRPRRRRSKPRRHRPAAPRAPRSSAGLRRPPRPPSRPAPRPTNSPPTPPPARRASWPAPPARSRSCVR